MEKKKIFFYILLITGVILLAGLIFYSGILDNLEIFRELNIALLATAILLTVLNVVVKIYRWKYLMKAYGIDIPFSEAGKTVMGSFFVSGLTPAKIGDVIKAYIMKRRYSLAFMDGVTGILYERVFELLLLFFVSLGVFYVGLSAKNYIVIQLTSFVIIFLIIAYIFSDKLLVWAQKLLSRTRIFKSYGDNLRLRKVRPLEAFSVFTLTGLALCLEFIRLWIVALAFGFQINIIHLSIFFCLSVLIGLLSQIPLGIGIVEGSLAVFLTDSGLPSYYAFGIVLVDRFISMYFVMALGLVYYKWALKSAMEDAG
jgi:uncharacterized protein (TIRG00374 family)